jgi:hypothetical protein
MKITNIKRYYHLNENIPYKNIIMGSVSKKKNKINAINVALFKKLSIPLSILWSPKTGIEEDIPKK